MKDIKNSKGSEKKFKTAQKLETIALWTQKTIKSGFYGFLAFCAVFFVIGSMSVAIFLGVFTAYMFIGYEIYQRTNPVIAFDFCVYNGEFAILMAVVAVIALALSSPITIITWPLLGAGIILFVANVIGVFGISVSNYYEE